MERKMQAGPFSSIELLQEDKDQYKAIVLAVIYDTLLRYNQYQQAGSVVNKFEWKHFYSQSGMEFYSERNSVLREKRRKYSADKVAYAPVQVLGLTNYTGDLDSVMFGMNRHDIAANLQVYRNGETDIKCIQRLAVVESPTVEQPYRSTGLYWLLKYIPYQPSAIVKPRDLFVVISTGMLLLEDGERLGYYVAHSVSYPGTEIISCNNAVRARMSHCTLFRQTSENNVQSYSIAYQEGNGRILDKIVAFTGADALRVVCGPLISAQEKKILWAIRRHNYVQGRKTTTDASDKEIKSGECQICQRSLSTFRKAKMCNVCDAYACSSCIASRDIAAHVPPRSLRTIKTYVCKHCVIRINHESAYQVACAEILAGRFDESREECGFDWPDFENFDEGLVPERRTCAGEDVIKIISATERASEALTLSMGGSPKHTTSTLYGGMSSTSSDSGFSSSSMSGFSSSFSSGSFSSSMSGSFSNLMEDMLSAMNMPGTTNTEMEKSQEVWDEMTQYFVSQAKGRFRSQT